MSIMQEIIAAVGITLVSSLLTYFITNIVQRDTYIAVVKELIEHHEKVWHKTAVEDAIDYHKKNCEASQAMQQVREMVLALYIKQGGRIEDLKF